MKKILIANRGEIALRIMKTLKRMGIQTVAVYSESDQGAPFVKFADEAYCLGASEPSESYLNVERVLAVALQTGSEGIHPGYGFLSENADFAQRVTEAGISFIGPPVEAIRTMGNKLDAKKAVKAFDVPMVSGTEEALKDSEEAKKVAASIGYPVLIKAAAGGGGKGMRIVRSEGELEAHFQRAVSEARSSFGDGAVFIEQFVQRPKHIEIQLLADQHGHVIHLNERECSVQRRHQKVIEEAPSAVVTAELRKKMGEAAVNVARSCRYVGVGTVEFLVDEEQRFYFLEMNTRLQVEHPVTEYITGLDLVEEQVKIARGEVLQLQQEDIPIRGHAIEVRVYAEDPENDFLPDLGTLVHYKCPRGIGVRVDDGYEQGMTIPLAYDPMIAKLIVHGKNRDEAIEKMIQAIDEYAISGCATTLGFCRFAIDHPEFRSGHFSIHFVDDHFQSGQLRKKPEAEMAAMAYALFQRLEKEQIPVREEIPLSAWSLKRK